MYCNVTLIMGKKNSGEFYKFYNRPSVLQIYKTGSQKSARYLIFNFYNLLITFLFDLCIYYIFNLNEIAQLINFWIIYDLNLLFHLINLLVLIFFQIFKLTFKLVSRLTGNKFTLFSRRFPVRFNVTWRFEMNS